jgi:hypothetical protein
MTLEELTNIFTHQLTPSEGYSPPAEMDYLLITNGDKIPGKVSVAELATLLETLNSGHYVHDAYRDRMPIFIVPDVIIPL